MEVFGGQPGTPSSARSGNRLSLRATSSIKRATWYFATLALFPVLLAAPASAQKTRPSPPSNPSRGSPPTMGGNPYGYGGPAANNGTYPGGIGYDPFTIMNDTVETLPPNLPVDTSGMLRAESCEDWTAAAVDSPTVSVGRLAVPGKASGQFQKACGSYKDKRFSPAEGHAVQALKIYPDYAAAWVLLGQIYGAENKAIEGRASCTQAKKVDPNYAASYVCLAAFAARDNDWRQAYELSDYALSLAPATNMYAYLYLANAELHLKQIDAAQSSAQSAETLDRWHKAPEIHLLLAQIYEAKGNRAEEIAELHQYLKFDPHAPDAKVAKATLAQVEAPRTK